MPFPEKHFDRQLIVQIYFNSFITTKINLKIFTFIMELLAVALVKPRHLELRTLETHGTIDLHEALSGPHVEDIR